MPQFYEGLISAAGFSKYFIESPVVCGRRSCRESIRLGPDAVPAVIFNPARTVCPPNTSGEWRFPIRSNPWSPTRRNRCQRFGEHKQGISGRGGAGAQNVGPLGVHPGPFSHISFPGRRSYFSGCAVPVPRVQRRSCGIEPEQRPSGIFGAAVAMPARAVIHALHHRSVVKGKLYRSSRVCEGPCRQGPPFEWKQPTQAQGEPIHPYSPDFECICGEVCKFHKFRNGLRTPGRRGMDFRHGNVAHPGKPLHLELNRKDVVALRGSPASPCPFDAQPQPSRCKR